MSKKVRRLFDSFKPKHYDITLTPERETKKVNGMVVVTGQKAGRPSQRLTFHQHGLKILSAKIIKFDKKGDREIRVTRINLQNTLDEVRLHTDEMIYPGPCRVELEFVAPIQESMHGIYFCNYEIDGAKKQLVATQFESHYAREAFPCIDEPEAKATFDLTMITPEGEICLSNTPASNQSTEDGKLKTVFETTPKMSTYLLAFVFGELQSKETKTKEGVDVRIWSTKAHRLEALDFAVDVAVRGIEFFAGYYGVPYPLTKCDHVALPDFAVGAMENWGLITYRETCLIADPATTSQSSRERIATVITHELSHQWFGNLVTMKWWDDLWLNESFANVMEYEAVDALFPDWKVWDTFKSSEGLSAIRRDCIAGVQSIKMPVHHPDEISTLFDPSIVYAKGGRLLNMLKDYLGEKDFRMGLKIYFETHAYANTIGDNLWQALSKASGKDVVNLMQPWLGQSGFPVVAISQNDNRVEISQQHFLLDSTKADKRLWPVPLLASDPGLPALLTAESVTALPKTEEYVRLNTGAVGHYIVHYTNLDHAEAIANLAGAKQLEPAERLMLLHDSSLLGRNGTDTFAATLGLLDHYLAEDNESVWGIMALIIADARRFIDADTKLEAPIKAKLRKLIQAQYKRLGWDEKPDEPADDTKLRALIIGLGVYAEHEEITKQALNLFEAYKKDSKVVASELRSIVLGTAVRYAVKDAFEYLVHLHESAQDAHLREDVMDALTSTHSEQEATLLLSRVTDPNKVKAQDAGYWMVMLLRNRYTRAVAWRWFRDNWDWIETTFKGDSIYDSFPRYAASGFNTRQYLAEYKEFFEPKTNQVALARNIALGIEEIENRATWVERDLLQVQAYFKQS